MDNPLLNKLNLLNNILNRDIINLKSIYSNINEIKNRKYDTIENYIDNLLYPETRKGVRIPSKVPLPTTTYNLRYTTYFTPNIYGNLLIWLNPCFLASDNVPGTYLYTDQQSYDGLWHIGLYVGNPANCGYNNQLALDGKTKGLSFTYRDSGSTIKDIYSSYRLVSGSVSLRYIKEYINASGTMGGCIIANETNQIGKRYYEEHVQRWDQLRPYNPNGNFVTYMPTVISQYTDFMYIRNGMYNQENSLLEGLRMLYFPLDNSFEEFTPVFSKEMVKSQYISNAEFKNPYKVIESEVNTGFNWFMYVQNGPSEENSIEMNVCLNFECLPKSEYLSYIPVDICGRGFSERDRMGIIKKIQKNIVSVYKKN